MSYLHRAVLLRAAAAALVLAAAMGGEAVVGPVLAKRGVERAAREASVCRHELHPDRCVGVVHH